MGKKKKNVFQFMQFGMIGIINAIVDIGSLNLLMIIWPTNEKSFLLLLNTISYSLAILNSYLLNSRLTFRKEAAFNAKEKLYFILQAGVSLGISNLVFIYGISIISMLPIHHFLVKNIAKGLAMFLSSSASFFMMKYLVFPSKKTVND